MGWWQYRQAARRQVVGRVVAARQPGWGARGSAVRRYVSSGVHKPRYASICCHTRTTGTALAFCRGRRYGMHACAIPQL